MYVAKVTCFLNCGHFLGDGACLTSADYVLSKYPEGV